MTHFADIQAAATRIVGVTVRTRTLVSPALDRLTGLRLFLKAEHEQASGSFKFRGALNAMLALTPAQLSRGVVAGSSGNHGRAVAMAAQLLGTTAVIALPRDVPDLKRDAVLFLEGRVVPYDRRHESRPLDLLVVPVGGGGLAAGCAVAVQSLSAATLVVGVEPNNGDDTRRSLAAGRRVDIAAPATIADGLRHQRPGHRTFEINRRLLRGVVLVSDAEIVAAMRALWEAEGIVAEPSGVCALAAVLAGRLPVAPGQRIGVVVSGGNIDTDSALRPIGHRSLTAAHVPAAIPISGHSGSVETNPGIGGHERPRTRTCPAARARRNPRVLPA